MGDVQDKSSYAALDEDEVSSYLDDLLNELPVIVKSNA